MAKRILSIVGDPGLRNARHMLLEAQGYEVVSVADLNQVRQACQNGAFDLAILGHSIQPSIKVAIAESIRQAHSHVPILEMCLVSPEVKGVEYSTSDSPADLVAMVSRILGNGSK